jgi:hypothetical protein
MKTAMKELIEFIKNDFENPYRILSILDKAIILSEKEQKQISASYTVGKAEAKMFPELNITGEEYYNKIYKCE